MILKHTGRLNIFLQIETMELIAYKEISFVTFTQKLKFNPYGETD